MVHLHAHVKIEPIGAFFADMSTLRLIFVRTSQNNKSPLDSTKQTSIPRCHKI